MTDQEIRERVAETVNAALREVYAATGTGDGLCSSDTVRDVVEQVNGGFAEVAARFESLAWVEVTSAAWETKLARLADRLAALEAKVVALAAPAPVALSAVPTTPPQRVEISVNVKQPKPFEFRSDFVPKRVERDKSGNLTRIVPDPDGAA